MTEKKITHFRLRYQKYKDKKYYYINPWCRECENKIASEYHNARKDDESFRKKNRERTRKYHQENREIIVQREKKRRQKKSYIVNRKKYIAKNKQKIYEQEKKAKKKYYDFHKNNLTDHYVISKIIQKTKLTKADVISKPDLIEAWRTKIKLIRLIKQKKNDRKTGIKD